MEDFITESDLNCGYLTKWSFSGELQYVSWRLFYDILVNVAVLCCGLKNLFVAKLKRFTLTVLTKEIPKMHSKVFVL